MRGEALSRALHKALSKALHKALHKALCLAVWVALWPPCEKCGPCAAQSVGSILAMGAYGEGANLLQCGA